MSLSSATTKTVIVFGVVAYVAGEAAAISLGATSGTALGNGALATIEMVKSFGDELQEGSTGVTDTDPAVPPPAQ